MQSLHMLEMYIQWSNSLTLNDCNISFCRNVPSSFFTSQSALEAVLGWACFQALIGIVCIAFKVGLYYFFITIFFTFFSYSILHFSYHCVLGGRIPPCRRHQWSPPCRRRTFRVENRILYTGCWEESQSVELESMTYDKIPYMKRYESCFLFMLRLLKYSRSSSS